MKKIFIDCGFHHGEGLRHFIKTLKMDETWHIITFEPNPSCMMMHRILEIMKEFPKLVLIDANVQAVWVCNGQIDFMQENHFKTNSGSPVDGRSMTDGWASRISIINSHKESVIGFEPSIKVECIDFSQVVENVSLRRKLLPEDHKPEIFIKMDIEGAEFPVLRKMAADGNLQYVKKLWVEFHERFVPGETFQSKKQLIADLSQHTEVIEWH